MLARVLRPLMVLLIAAPLALVGVLALQSPAAACSCQPLTFKQQVKRADTVFLAEVAAAGTPSGNDLTYDVVARRVFKGDLSSSSAQVTTAADPGSCGLGPLEVGETWLFLVKGGSSTTCLGSAPATTEVMERAQRRLGIGTRLDPPAPTEAVRTKVEDAEPRPFTRVAAPGAALVLIGLLGLAVVGRLGRAR